MGRGVAYRQRAAAGFALVVAARVASGEVATDGSLGPAQGIAAVTNEYRITDDLGRYSDNGASLYHSFSLFDVEAGRTASFSATRTPERVIARVTGDSISQIDGRLRTTEAAVGADLFLLNPSGITFGPGASLDLKGSFHVSTAERLHFVSGPDFDATSSAPDAALSTAAPSAFGFLGSAPAPINFDQTSGLSLPAGETFSAIGGPVRLTGNNRPGIRIPSGRIQLAAVDHAADVPLDLASFGGAALEPAVAGDDIPDVALEQGFNLDVSGDFAAAGSAGQVVIRGGSLLVAGSRIDATHRSAQAASAPAIDIQMVHGVDVRSGARLTSQGFTGAGRGADVVIDATERLTVSGGANGTSNISADSRVIGEITPIPGGAGDLSVRTGSLELRDGGQISASTEGARNSGCIRITADSVVVSGSDPAFGNASGLFSRSNADFEGGGDAQGIEIAATGDVILSQGGTLSSSTVATGDAGTIDVIAGGNVSITAGTFFKAPDSSVDASSALGIDGSVSIVAPDTDVTSGVTTLPSVFLDATTLLKNACSATSAEGGSFVVSTRPALPMSPDAPLTAFAGAVTAAGSANARPASQVAASVVLAGENRARGCGRTREEVL